MRLSGPVRRRVLDRDGWRCVRCGAAARLEVDHIRPRRAGGGNDEANLRTLCRSCHIARHRRKKTSGELRWDAYLATFD